MLDDSPTLELQRTRSRTRELPLTPLIDVVFILIIFFMLTTSFMKVESMELLLPSAKGSQAAEKTSLAHVFLQNDGSLLFGQRKVDREELERTLKSLFVHNPEQRVVLLSANAVSLQRLVELMDLVYLAGGKSVYVKAWNDPAQGDLPAQQQPVVSQ